GSLAEHYKQLSKYSSSIGSWVVPLNPFAEALVGLRTRCQNEIQEANEQEIAQELESLRQQEGALNAKMALCNQEILDAYERISTMLAQHNRPPVKNFIQSELAVSWPLIEQFTPDDRSRLEEEHDRFEQDLRDLEQEELELSSRLQITGERLDLDEARQQMEAQEHNYQIKKHSVSMIEALNQRMMQKMLPHTEHYMQQLLPLLTSGRYHDVKLGTDDKGALQMQIWESAANEYVVTSTVSGGTSDQLSLTLRLAFAIAALPRDLTAAPGFLMLDEPLSAFDRGRTRALVDVITGEMLGQHFEQVFFISHSNTFEAGMFPYHIYMDNGIVVDSNLPVVSTLSLPESNGTYLSDDADQDVPTIPQTDPLPAIVSVEQA
ncbi:MAG TPA: hypothetical protein VFN23_03955, partial [Ktedonobacteraceae bacterium]|nr:hypothetical protein [Ktedonobacteraceae bacterium]